MSGLEVAITLAASLSTMGMTNLGPRVRVPQKASPVRAGFGVSRSVSLIERRRTGMGTSILSIFKTVMMAIAVVAVMALSHSMAKADEVTVAGYTNGCFNCNPPPVPN